MRASLMAIAAMVAAPLLMAGQPGTTDARVTRATAVLNGVFSPRGFFNITVRLYGLDGLDAAKFDLKKSRITLDFKPGVTVTEGQIQKVMRDAGYKPGDVEIQRLAPDLARRSGPGWVKIKHPQARNGLVRWFELNF